MKNWKFTVLESDHIRIFPWQKGENFSELKPQNSEILLFCCFGIPSFSELFALCDVITRAWLVNFSEQCRQNDEKIKNLLFWIVNKPICRTWQDYVGDVFDEVDWRENEKPKMPKKWKFAVLDLRI